MVMMPRMRKGVRKQEGVKWVQRKHIGQGRTQVSVLMIPNTTRLAMSREDVLSLLHDAGYREEEVCDGEGA